MRYVRLKKPYYDRKTSNYYYYGNDFVPEVMIPAEIRDNPEYVEYKAENESAVIAIEDEVTTTSINVEMSADDRIVEPSLDEETIQINNYVKSEEIAEEAAERIDVNTASEAELLKLKGVGKALAKRIVEERAKKRFESLEELNNRLQARIFDQPNFHIVFSQE